MRIRTKLKNIERLAIAEEQSGNFKASYGHYQRILEQDAENWRAWLGKGFAAGHLLSHGQPGFKELIEDTKRALHLCPKESVDGIRKEAAQRVLMAVNGYRMRGDLPLEKMVETSAQAIEALELAHQIDPLYIAPLERLVQIFNSDVASDQEALMCYRKMRTAPASLFDEKRNEQARREWDQSIAEREASLKEAREKVEKYTRMIRDIDPTFSIKMQFE